jgi:hypothetical protein
MKNLKKENNYFIYDQSIAINFKFYIKLLLLFILDIVYKIILKLYNNKTKDKEYGVSICAIFKNEAHNMREWIEFHKIVGIEHFYLYNNFSNDNYLEVLDFYVNDGLVTLIEWPVEKGQFPAYQHFYENFRNSTNWVTFLDLDEFVTPFYKKTISEWLVNYKNYPCIVLYWKMFGSSGKIEHDFDQLTTEQYTVSWDKMATVGKVFLNTDFDIASFDANVHHATVVKVKLFNKFFLIPPINEFKKIIRWDIHRMGFFNKSFTIQINHYWSKSFGYYFENKVKRGDVNNHDRTIDQFYYTEFFNRASDHKIFRYLIELRRALGQTKTMETDE